MVPDKVITQFYRWGNWGTEVSRGRGRAGSLCSSLSSLFPPYQTGAQLWDCAKYDSSGRQPVLLWVLSLILVLRSWCGESRSPSDGLHSSKQMARTPLSLYRKALVWNFCSLKMIKVANAEIWSCLMKCRCHTKRGARSMRVRQPRPLACSLGDAGHITLTHWASVSWTIKQKKWEHQFLGCCEE